MKHAANVWNPHLKQDIRALKSVQKFALRNGLTHFFNAPFDHKEHYTHIGLERLPVVDNRIGTLETDVKSWYSIIGKTYIQQYMSHFVDITVLFSNVYS